MSICIRTMSVKFSLLLDVCRLVNNIAVKTRNLKRVKMATKPSLLFNGKYHEAMTRNAKRNCKFDILAIMFYATPNAFTVLFNLMKNLYGRA